MDPISAIGLIGSIVSVTDAGIKLSLGFYNLAQAVRTSNKSITLVSNDVSATCGILTQLKDLAQPKKREDGQEFSIFNDEGLETLRNATGGCRFVFEDLRTQLVRASHQVAGKTKPDAKIELSYQEKAKWPFAQPKIQGLRVELSNIKSNLVLILSVAHLAYAKRVALM